MLVGDRDLVPVNSVIQLYVGSIILFPQSTSSSDLLVEKYEWQNPGQQLELPMRQAKTPENTSPIPLAPVKANQSGSVLPLVLAFLVKSSSCHFISPIECCSRQCKSTIVRRSISHLCSLLVSSPAPSSSSSSTSSSSTPVTTREKVGGSGRTASSVGRPGRRREEEEEHRPPCSPRPRRHCRRMRRRKIPRPRRKSHIVAEVSTVNVAVVDCPVDCPLVSFLGL
jgi:hypothetical protein